MLEYNQTTVFNLDTQAIVNTVNCVGVMGAGLALEFKLRFPQMYANYVAQCRKKEITIGQVTLYRNSHTPDIINFPTKNHWKYPSKLDWIEAGLQHFVAQYQNWGITSIAFPKLGCDRGGLNWSQVKVLMEKYLSNQPNLNVYICLDNETTAQGIEKQMLDLLNQRDLWVKQLNLSDGVMERITNTLPLQRFRNLKNISGVGQETYQEMFKFLYNLAAIDTTIINIDEGIFLIPELRLRLVMLLNNLGFNSQEISQLTVKNVFKQGRDLVIEKTSKESAIIPLKIWEKMEIDLAQLEPEQPLIQNKQKRGKPIKANTVKTLISRGNKLLKQNEVKQLTLF